MYKVFKILLDEWAVNDGAVIDPGPDQRIVRILDKIDFHLPMSKRRPKNRTYATKLCMWYCFFPALVTRWPSVAKMLG